MRTDFWQASLLVVLAGGCGAVGDPSAAVGVDVKRAAVVDTSLCPRGSHIIIGTSGDDVLIGTNGRDCILGLEGNDRIEGRDGDDVLIGGPGNDVLRGGNGDDVLIGGDGDDQLDGGNGDDTLIGGAGNDVLIGGNGNDALRGEAGNDVLAGNNGNDVITGDEGDDVIEGGSGRDAVNGGAGVDACAGPGCELAAIAVQIGCRVDADCAGGLRCAASGVCVACIGDAECDDQNPCTTDSCQPALGCRHPALPDGSQCPDATVCNGQETCKSGTCVSGVPLSCDDGLFCNGEETCDPQLGCQPGAPPSLDDGVACTVDSCDEPSRSVAHVPDDALCVAGFTCDAAKGCEGLSVSLSVTATEPTGNPLSYRWRVTEGFVSDVNASVTTWVIPPGPGLHFAYALVANGKGGYTERRIAVSTDDIGLPAVTRPPRAVTAPAAPAPVGNPYQSVIRGNNAYAHELFNGDADGIYLPDIPVYLQDSATGATTPEVKTDLRGYYTIPNVQPGSYNVYFRQGASLIKSNDVTMGTEAYSDYYGGPRGDAIIVGRALLSNGSPCGTIDEFFGIESTGSATLLDQGGNVIAGPVRTNRWGHFALPELAAASAVRVDCEGTSATSAVTSDQLEPTVLADSAAPVVSGMSATFNGNGVGLFLPPPHGLPSDNVAGSDVFFTFKGIDSRKSACQYYLAIGAVKACSADGTPSGLISFDDWKRATRMEPYAEAGKKDFVATYVNAVDLNLTRNHHSISYGATDTAGYVCNHLGPKDPSQASIDEAVDNATKARNLVACVAMDYRVTPGVNGDRPFTRFLIFGPTGQVLPSINLDGRAEKFVPGVCVACHGGDRYAGRFPEDGSGAADVGAHFLPYDVGNFVFSSKPGLTEAEQTEAIYGLNQNVLAAGPTVGASELIAGWYAAGHQLDKNYLPVSWQGQSAAAQAFYDSVYARNCRTCHVNFSEWLNLDHFDNIGNPASPLRNDRVGLDIAACGFLDSLSFVRDFAMPNSLVTFNRYWSSSAALAAFPPFMDELTPGWSGPCELRPSPIP